MERSETITELAAALVAAQSKIAGAVKDKENPHYKSAYADLSSVAEACKGPLNDNGIAYVQTPEPAEGNNLRLTTILIHKSGQWISGTCQMPLSRSDPQGYGSALTYARRYGLASIAGVCPEDDDAEGAVGHPPAPPKPQQKQQVAPVSTRTPSEDEQFQIKFGEALDARGFTPADKTAVSKGVCAKRKIRRLTELKAADRADLLDKISSGAFDKLKKAVS